MSLKTTSNYLKTFICLLLSTYLLTACGFQLRGQYLLAPELQTLTFSASDKHGELARLVKQHLMLNNVKIVTSSKRPVPELKILKDNLDRRTLSVLPNGQVAEYELIYKVRYQIALVNKETQTFEFELNRDYQDDPNLALAKSRELNLLLSEMRKLAADRILREMASIRL